MFSEFIVSALQSSGLDEQAQQALGNLLGNCSLPLSHKAPVTLEVPTNESTSINYQTFMTEIRQDITNHTDNYISYSFSPQLYSYIDNTTTSPTYQQIIGGLSIYAPGVNYVQDLITDAIYTNNLYVTTNGTQYCFVEKEVVTDVASSFDSGTCELTLTLTTEVIKVFEECP